MRGADANLQDMDNEDEMFCDGTSYTRDDFEEEWQLDFDDEPELISGIEACAEINADRCETATIAKLHGDAWLVYWKERHPEMLTYDEMFPAEIDRFAKRTKARLKEWEKFRALLPDKVYARRITRQQAFLAIASIYLPKEFHGDAGLSEPNEAI